MRFKPAEYVGSADPVRDEFARRVIALEAAIMQLSVKCTGEMRCPGYKLSYELGLCPPRSSEETKGERNG